MTDETSWEDLIRTVERAEQRWWRRLLPQFIHHRLFGDPRERRQRYEAARQQVKRQYDELLRTIDPVLEDVAADIESAMEGGEALTERAASAQEAKLDWIQTEIEAFHGELDAMVSVDAPPDALLRSAEHDVLRDRTERVNKFEAFLQAKPAFDTQMSGIERELEDLGEQVSPYRSYEQYLTYPERDELESRCDRLSARLDALEDDCDLDELATSDQQRATELACELDGLHTHLSDYNEAFVERRCAEYDDLFSDIDDEGNDLNRAQREAIVTNDVRNLVVAAAGTGKTLALTYRIAYLVAEGTPPSRIVALTFTRQAAREMEIRLADRFGIDAVDVRTIHSFAYEIARDTADEHLDVVDGQDLYNLIDTIVRDTREGKHERFRQHYTQFLFHYDHTHLTEADFESRAEYVAERRAETYETLAGETVASRAEQGIADFLFTHDVEYQYEAVAAWADSADDKGQYRPDFYLPEQGVYIEHWGIDENGEVAPWFSWDTDQYHEKLVWAREQFADSDHTLVETYDFEHEAGWLEDVLRYRLDHVGVPLRRLGFEEFVDRTFEYNEKERDIKESLASFVRNAKTFGIDAEEARARLSRTRPRQYYFGRCGAIVLEEYNAYLDRAGLVDFDDMINDATAAVRADPDPYRSQYDHILVDEFQDVSTHQVELIRTLAGGAAGPRLFCVGDDWQSIYAFQGADIQQFIAFDDHFGPTAETRLTRNYRSPKIVVEAGNALISNYDQQIPKTVTAARDHDCQPKLHVLDGYTDSKYEQRVGQYVVELVTSFLSDENEPGDVMVLCRYDEGAGFTDRVKEELARRDLPYDGKADHYRPPEMPDEYDPGFDPDAGVAVYSVHQAKGRQAKQVIVLNVASGMYGFPAEHRENSLVAPVQEIDTATIEEERRLFYVALTRTESELHVLTRANQWSPFIDEIEPYLTVEESVAQLTPGTDDLSITAKVRMIWEDRHDTQHQAGVLEDTTGTVRFVSWASESPPTVEEGVWYRFENVEINEFDADPQVVLRSDTTARVLYQVETN